MDVCVQLFIPRDTSEETSAAILEKQAFPSSFYVFNIQTFKYPRIYHPQVCSFLKLWKLLKSFMQTFVIELFRCIYKISFQAFVHPSFTPIDTI